jgi:hypothetical protein
VGRNVIPNMDFPRYSNTRLTKCSTPYRRTLEKLNEEAYVLIIMGLKKPR